ncbi:uncharacterized protein Tco025E_03013 [Trypanosoma conorhini]|uniref:Uncharacterized protein n=1 Tax=Trypanosoma conorhini TaxID=83891 RepID=A0A3R7NS96_9TRYP|nr:uncharacterized protein Tco025E_03013 [Trypanosoma conorhini]RNF22686.1 hypothetical protein Tco025E_03013 [Trypanosoma conorhini]
MLPPPPAPPQPPAAKQAPAPTANWEASSPIPASFKVLGGAVVPAVLSGVNGNGTPMCESSLLKPGKVRAVSDDGCASGGVPSPLPKVVPGGQRPLPSRESLDAPLLYDAGGDGTSRKDSGESPESSVVTREKLLRLLGRIACSGEEASYSVASPGVTINDNRNVIQSCYGEEHVFLDDLFVHVLSALEKVVQQFLCRALTREWTCKLKGEVSPPSPSAADAARLWTTAWRQAQHRDEEAWIAWRSALCRSWRRTRRESASRERGEALNAALFQFDPCGGAATRGAPAPSSRAVETRQTETAATKQRLYALLYRVFWTCPALLLDEDAQRLAAAADFSLDSVRLGICAAGEDEAEAEAEEITGFIRSLSRRGQAQAREADLATLEEVERLFATERRALLRRLGAGQPPPSPCGPSPDATTPTTRYAAATPPRYVEPTPIQLRPPSLTPLGGSSPAARIPDGAERLWARQIASPSYEAGLRASDEHHGALDMRAARRPSGSEGRRVQWPVEAGEGASAARSPTPRFVDRAEPERRLPSALRTPRSVSWW